MAAFAATKLFSAPHPADLAVCFLIFGLGFIVLGIGYARDVLRQNQRARPSRRCRH
jgi:hypothetical protein